MQVADSFHAVGRQSETFGLAGTFSATNESLVVIWYQKPNRLLWKWGSGRVVFDGSSVYPYEGGEPVAYRSPAPSLPSDWMFWFLVPMAGPTDAPAAFDEQKVLGLLAASATAVQSDDAILLRAEMPYQRWSELLNAMGRAGGLPWAGGMPPEVAQVFGGINLKWEVGLNATDYLPRYLRAGLRMTNFPMVVGTELRFSTVACNRRVPAYKFKFRPPEGVEVREGPRPSPTFGPFPEPEKPPAVSYTDFTLEDVHGLPLSLREYSGKVILLNFWATWCAPCRQEIPELEAFWQAHRNDGDVVLLAISEDETGTDLHSFVAQQGITFPVLADEQGKVRDLYSVKFYPTTIVFDRGQKHLRTLVGAQTRATLEEVLTQARAAP